MKVDIGVCVVMIRKNISYECNNFNNYAQKVYPLN